MSEHDSKSLLFSPDTLRDISLWRRKKLSLLVVLVATVTWMLLDVYEFNFITVASWLAMLIVTSLFLYGNLVRLFRKEEPNLSNWEVSDDTAIETAKSVREMIVRGIRWMFYVSTERDWSVFARVVAVLWLLSYVGSFFDFLTLLYICMVVGMTVPVIYIKNEDRIKTLGQRMKMQARRIYETVDKKVFKKVKDKVAKVDEEKDKKVE